MNTRLLTPLTLRTAAAGLALLLAANPGARAGLNGAYGLDANTILLWHLDDGAATGIATNAVAGKQSLMAIANPSSVATRPLLSDVLGAAGASGTGYNFGNCANLSFSNSMALVYDGNANGTPDLDAGSAGGDAIPTTEFTGPDGSFTIEALVNLQSLSGANREIVSMDTSGAPRPFLFRVSTSGLLEFNGIATFGSRTAAIPTTGTDAFVANQWFHAAVVFDGTAQTLSFYWTKLDPARTNANSLTNIAGVTGITPTGSAVLVAGNENRNTSGEGLLGKIDEVRISNVARTSSQMVFNTSAAPIPPTIDPQPADQFLGVGEMLVISSHASGSPPLRYQWQKSDGVTFTNLANETNEILSLPVTFAMAGAYRYIVTNTFNRATSQVANVTVGAVFSEVFKTALTNGTDFGAGGDMDAHYSLYSSSDITRLGTDVLVMAEANPIGDYNPNDANSKWVAPALNPSAPARGPYVYRIAFLVDSANATGASLQGTTLSGGPLEVWLNGQPTGFTNPATTFPGPHRISFSFNITNGFVAGVNTLDFLVDNSNGLPNSQGFNALRVSSLRGIGTALPAGLPTLTNPASKTVRDGGKVSLETVAQGRPPLSYQWYADGTRLTDATNRVLKFNPVSTGSQGTNFLVVVSNDSGSRTSLVAKLTIVPTNQPPIAGNLNFSVVLDQTLNIAISRLLRSSTEPDGDLLSFTTADATSTNGASVVQTGALLTYTPNAGYIGADQFSYTISDDQSASAVGFVRLNIAPLTAPLLSAQRVANNIVLSATGGTPGGSYHLLSSTDVAAALGTWTSTAGTFDASGNLSVTNPIAAGAGQTFYRLQVP